MESTPRHSVSVAAVILNEDESKVLLIRRRDNHMWEPPGGVLELDETLEAGVQREVLEETGVHVQVQHLSGVYKNMVRGVVALVFRCTALTDSLPETPESSVVAWLPIENVSQLMLPPYAIRITDALKTNPINVRAHDGYRLWEAQPSTPG